MSNTTTLPGGNTFTSNSSGVIIKTGGSGRNINLENNTGGIVLKTTDTGIQLPVAPLDAADGGTGLTTSSTVGSWLQSNGSGGWVAHGPPLGIGALAISDGDGYWESSPLPNTANTVLYWTGSALIWTTLASATIQGTYTPTLLVNPAFDSSGGKTFLDRPNYLSGGQTASYYIQRGTWSSKALVAGGSTIYEVDVSVYLVVTSYTSVPSVGSFTISLPFTNTRNDMSSVLSLQNTNGQISVPIYSMNGQNYVAGFQYNIWNPINGVDDLWQFSMTYYTTTAP